MNNFWQRVRQWALPTLMIALGLGSSLPLYAQDEPGTIVDTVAELDPGEVFRIEAGDLRQIAFSPDETILAVATSAGLWIYAPTEESNGELLAEEPVQSLWWSADSTLLAATLDDGALQLWQLPERELLGLVDGVAGAIVSVAWAPDGAQLATGSSDGMIEVWSVSEGIVLETLEGHTDSIRNLYWIADGTQIVSAAADGSVRVWGVEVAASPTPTATPEPAPQPAFATVQVDRLNVRSGPGMDFPRIATGLRGEDLTVLDQADDCAWLQVQTPAGDEGWVAGDSQFVLLDVDCSEVGQPVSAPTPTPQATTQPTTTGESTIPLPTPSPTATGTAEATATGTISVTETPAATLTPAATTAAAEPPEDPYPADQGCYLFQNELPVALTLDLTGASTGSSETIELPADEEALNCFEPDQYAYTIRYRISEPAEITGELNVTAGDRFMFPIRAE